MIMFLRYMCHTNMLFMTHEFIPNKKEIQKIGQIVLTFLCHSFENMWYFYIFHIFGNV